MTRGVVESHNPSADFGNDRVRDYKRLSEQPIEAVGDVASQLDVLALIVPYRHFVGAVQYDVPGHENGIVEQSGGYALHPGRLVLVLRHALQPSDGRNAVENPARLGVGGDVALDE